jgi:hypothetical protein
MVLLVLAPKEGLIENAFTPHFVFKTLNNK